MSVLTDALKKTAREKVDETVEKKQEAAKKEKKSAIGGYLEWIASRRKAKEREIDKVRETM